MLWVILASLILSIRPSLGFSFYDALRLCGRQNSHLFGIDEWRTSPSIDDHQTREIFMLPFGGSEILLPGERRTIVLKDGRFFDLFQDVIDGEHGVVGMALMGEDFLLPTIILCEIHDYQIDTGFRGRISIQATLESVGRAEMLELLQMKPVMKAVCRELQDDVSIDVESEQTRTLVQNVKELSIQILQHSSFRTLSSDDPNDPKHKLEAIKCVDALTWESLSMIRETVELQELLQIVESKSAAERLAMVHRLLQGSLLARPYEQEGSLLDEPSSFE